MVTTEQIQQLASDVDHMTREEIKTKLLHYDGRPKLDFTESYLDQLSESKLRHILMAALTYNVACSG